MYLPGMTRYIFTTSMFLFSLYFVVLLKVINPLSANHTKWSNTLKQFVGNLPTICFSVFDHFVGLALKGLTGIIRTDF